MLWIAVYLPELSLQLALRGTDGDVPFIVSHGPANRPVVRSASRAARTAGIRAGMAVAAAQALVGKLPVVLEQPPHEQDALTQLACWAGQYTPSVVIEAREGLLLEVATTARLFGGLRRLGSAISMGARSLGYGAFISVAPTPLGAWLMAKAKAQGSDVKGCTRIDELRARLGPLPLGLFDWPDDTLATLRELAVTTIDQCLTLPRDGLIRRFGSELMDSLDRALGRLPDPRRYFVAPESYRGRVEFSGEVDNTQALLFPLRRLLGELEGFLRGRGCGVEEVTLLINHGRLADTPVICRMASPERHADRILGLLQERLPNVVLPACASGIVLQTGPLLPLTPRNQSWLPDRRQRAQQLTHLRERLTARLGPARVISLAVADDHRPERAWCDSSESPASVDPFPLRPTWLLETPQPLSTRDGKPLYRGSLQLLAGPERIEGGWWDCATVGRDYFVACNRHGEALWIFRELGEPRRWFLHGIFA